MSIFKQLFRSAGVAAVWLLKRALRLENEADCLSSNPSSEALWTIGNIYCAMICQNETKSSHFTEKRGGSSLIVREERFHSGNLGVWITTVGMWVRKVEQSLHYASNSCWGAAEQRAEPSIATFAFIHVHKEEQRIILCNQAMAGNQMTRKAFIAQHPALY